MRYVFLIVLTVLITTGCATNCQNVEQRLVQCNATLADKDLLIQKQGDIIQQKEQQIADSNKNIEQLKREVAELKRQLGISTTEKGRHDERARNLAASVREYIQKQIRDNSDFLTNIALEDFIGDEIINREHSGGEKTMIINVAHPVPSGGQINGIGGYFTGPTDLVIKLLRPVGVDYVVIYTKALKFDVSQPGKKYVDFDRPFIVKKGDILAYYFPGPVTVPYDSNIGTNAYSEMSSDEYAHGSRVLTKDIWHEDQVKRKYSLNYYGVFFDRTDTRSTGGPKQ